MKILVLWQLLTAFSENDDFAQNSTDEIDLNTNNAKLESIVIQSGKFFKFVYFRKKFTAISEKVYFTKKTNDEIGSIDHTEKESIVIPKMKSGLIRSGNF